MSNPPSVELDVSVQVTHPGVNGAVGTGTLGFDDAVTVLSVTTETGTALLLEGSGVVSPELPALRYARPVISFPSLPSGTTTILVGADTKPLLVNVTVDPRMPVGLPWVINLQGFGSRSGTLTQDQITAGIIAVTVWIENISSAVIPPDLSGLPAPVVTFPTADGLNSVTGYPTISGTAYRTLTSVQLSVPIGAVAGNTWSMASGVGTSTGVLAAADITAGFIVTKLALPIGTTATVTASYIASGVQGHIGSGTVELVLLGISGVNPTNSVYFPNLDGFLNVSPQPVVDWTITVNGIPQYYSGSAAGLIGYLNNIPSLNAMGHLRTSNDLAISNATPGIVRLEITEATQIATFISSGRNPTFAQVQQGFQVTLAPAVVNSYGVVDSSLYQYKLPGLTGFVSIGQAIDALASWLATPNGGWYGETMVFDHVVGVEPYTGIVFRNATVPLNPASFNASNQVSTSI
jgi:hypothetical protein